MADARMFIRAARRRNATCNHGRNNKGKDKGSTKKTVATTTEEVQQSKKDTHRQQR